MRGKRFFSLCLAVALLALNAAALADGASETLRGWDEDEGYQYVLFGRYEQQSGEAEPILWRVLTVKNEKALLLSEYILDTRPLSEESKKEREEREAHERKQREERGEPEPTPAPDGYVEWEDTDMRHWLNSHFQHTAFNAAERRALPEAGKLGYVFLPSRGELTEAAYGFNPIGKTEDPARATTGTRYADDQGLNIQPSENSPYFTRTKDSNTTYTQIRSTGEFGSARYDRDNVGMRPAIWLDLTELELTGGEGTMEEPFTTDL